LVARFNQHGLAALSIAAGRGRKGTYTPVQRERIIQELQREPDRKADGTATWSLKTLERSLRKEALPRVGKSTIREVLRGARALALAKRAPGVPPAPPCASAKPGQCTYRTPRRPKKNLDRTSLRARGSGRHHAAQRR
jgi:hypothetical protein